MNCSKKWEFFTLSGNAVCHIVQPGLSVQKTGVGREGIIGLLGSHAVYLRQVGRVVKTIVHGKGTEGIHHALVVFDEALFLLRIQPQSREGDDNLGAGFAVRRAPAGKPPLGS